MGVVMSYKINLFSIIVGLIFFGLAPVANAMVVNFGGYTGPVGDMRAALQNSTNFSNLGITGAVDKGPVAFGGVTNSYLSTIDIFFTGRSAITSAPSVSDVQNLESFVNGGGTLIINNDRSTSFTLLDPLLNTFGVDIVEASTSVIETLNILAPTHAIMNGPFGQVGTMGLGDASRYSITGSSVTALASWQNGDIAMAVLGPDISSGRLGAVIILPDVERFLLYFDNSFGSGDTNIAALNSLAYAINPSVSAVPVPAALPLFGTGLAIMGFLGWRRKRKAA